MRCSVIITPLPKCVMGLYTHKKIRNYSGRMVGKMTKSDSAKLILLSSLHWLSMIIINYSVFPDHFYLNNFIVTFYN